MENVFATEGHLALKKRKDALHEGLTQVSFPTNNFHILDLSKIFLKLFSGKFNCKLFFSRKLNPTQNFCIPLIKIVNDYR